jgi:hypothetical protein
MAQPNFVRESQCCQMNRSHEPGFSFGLRRSVVVSNDL